MDQRTPTNADTVREDDAKPDENDKSGASEANKEARKNEDGGPDQKDENAKPDAQKDETEDAPKENILRRHPILILIAIVILIAAIVAGVLWYLNARHFESTDDAFIDGRPFAISPKVSGYVINVAVTDNQDVKAGALVAQIDPRDYENSLAESEARRKGAADQITNIDAQIAAQQAQIDQTKSQVTQANAALSFAQQQYDRANQLVKTGAGTVQNNQQTESQLRQAEANLAGARASESAAEKQVGVLQAQRANAVASQSEAKAERDQARLNLEYTTMQAAQDGRVVKLTGAKGAYVTPGTNIAMFVPNPIWVTANFKETQITDMRPGQKVDIAIDAYPDRKFEGRVASIQPGSGTVFSILPAQNATGNYVKVVQRVPVKIVFDHLPDDIVLGPGMSVVPSVRVR